MTPSGQPAEAEGAARDRAHMARAIALAASGPDADRAQSLGRSGRGAAGEDGPVFEGTTSPPGWPPRRGRSPSPGGRGRPGGRVDPLHAPSSLLTPRPYPAVRRRGASRPGWPGWWSASRTPTRTWAVAGIAALRAAGDRGGDRRAGRGGGRAAGPVPETPPDRPAVGRAEAGAHP